MKNKDFRPKSIDEVKALEEIKSKNQTDKFSRWVFVGCLIFLAASYIFKAIAPSAGLTLDGSADTLLNVIADIAKITFGGVVGKTLSKS